MKKSFFKTDQEKEQFLDWIITLESGIFKQTIGNLQDLNGFCCLGVGTALFCEQPYSQRIDGRSVLIGITANCQLGNPQWFKNINTEFGHRTGKSLMTLNDDKMSFKLIAKLLKETFKEDLIN